jgi:N-acetylglutamate synthase-like GNAT family acetyltransferase
VGGYINHIGAQSMTLFSEEALCIRLATLDDTQYIAKIKIENHQRDDHPLDRMLNEVFMREYIKRYTQQIKDGICTLILSQHDETLGFISYCVSPQQNAMATAEIKNIYVKPECRGNKLGKLLLSSALAKMKQEQVLQVMVWLVEGRTNTTCLYESMGFTKIGRASCRERV